MNGPLTRVTTSDARKLDRALGLFASGKISYDRWRETLDAWVRGEDVEGWDYGDAEPMTQRLRRMFRGKTASTREVSLGMGRDKASYAGPLLIRLAKAGHVEKLSRGLWRFK